MDTFAQLTGKVALVTGAAMGIGKATAEILAQGGAAVMLSDMNKTALQSTYEEFADKGYNTATVELNVVNPAQWQSAIDACIDEFGALDILVNNAGIYVGGLLINNELEDVRRVQEVNVDSIFLGTQAAAKVMKPGSSIINLSSIAGIKGVPGHSAYGASKGAVRAYTKHCAVEFSRMGTGIRVNSVHPGLIATAMGEQVFQDFVDCGMASNTDEAREAVNQMTPMGRSGTIDEVANVIRFLASDAASYCTGGEFLVDGGLSA